MRAFDKALKDKLKKYDIESFDYLERAMVIIRKLLDRNYESYVVGDAVRNFCLTEKIETVEIITNCKREQLLDIFPAMNVDKNDRLFLLDDGKKFYFTFFDFVPEAALKTASHFNKKLEVSLRKRVFTVDAFALSPNYVLTDIFDNQADVQDRIARIKDKPRNFFKENPKCILDAFVLMAKYDFIIEKNTFKLIKKNIQYLNDISKSDFIYYLTIILRSKYQEQTLTFIKKKKLFKYCVIFDEFIRKILGEFGLLSYEEKLTVLALILKEGNNESILSEENVDEQALKAINENVLVTQLVMKQKITPMMIYNVGPKKLLFGNNIAMCYNKSYDDQSSTIKKLTKNRVIKNERELNFSSLELTMMLDGERGLKIKAIMNILLERVINGQIPNIYEAIKIEALNVVRMINEIYDFDTNIDLNNLNEENVQKLKALYEERKNFLVKVYLNNEKELYNLTEDDRNKVIDNAKEHAREFLSKAPQYRILKERGII